MTPTPPDSDSLTLQQVADEFDVHYMTAYRWVRLGMLNATKVGRSWVVTREDLEAYKGGSQEPSDRGTAPWDERLLNRMLAADDSGSWAVVESALTSGMSVEDVYTRMVVPALRSVGDGWEAGTIGIAEEHLPHIFDKFYMVDGGIARQVGGTGVGLYLVREIVKLHKGVVDVRSDRP